MLLSFNVQKQIITRTDTESVVCNSMNFLYAQFTFSEEWTGTKTAVFKGKEKTYNALLDENDTCLVPWEVLTESWFYVSVFCGDLVTANKVTIYTIPSGYEIGDESRIPTPEIYNQIIEKLDGINAESIPYDNAQSGMDAENVQEALDELAQGGGGGGSVVVVTPTLLSGTKIAEIDVDGNSVDLFAPEGIENVTENTELQIVDDNENVGVEIGSDDWENASFMEKYGFGGFPYGYENLPPKNKFSGLVESDMFIVDGGKGRWNGVDTGNALQGGHLFEGWNAPHDARLTFGIGMKDKDVSFIATFRPHSTEAQNDGYYGIVKIGDDREKAGTVFTNGLEKHNGLMCLATSIPNDTSTATQRLATSGELAQTDYDSTANIPYGAMYFDLTEQKVKVYTSSGWKSLSWEA